MRVREDRELLAQMIMEMTRLYRITLREQAKIKKPIPRLYESGVRYMRRENNDPIWRLDQVIESKSADAEEIVAWRLAELEEAGINVRLAIISGQTANSHRCEMVLELLNGTIENPIDLFLGIKGTKVAEDLVRLHSAGSVNGQKVFTDQECQRCGHLPCPCCWACGIYSCDRIVGEGEDLDLCCDGECSYISPPSLFNSSGAPWSSLP